MTRREYRATNVRCQHRTLLLWRCRREAVTGRTLGARSFARCAKHPIRKG
jgi:hypothetical protein